MLSDAEEQALSDAQDLVFDAWDATTARRRLALARKALKTSPHCADAYHILAQQEAPGSAAELDLLEKAVAAGEAAVGARAFEEDVGFFWGMVETRPYMRARQMLAIALERRGRLDEAAAHLRDMLRLNPNDNQGLRYILASQLVRLHAHAELDALLKRYKEASAFMLWTRALSLFQRGGDTAQARTALTRARRSNEHVAGYLTGATRMPAQRPGYYSPGEASEALSYVDDMAQGWRITPGALDWLRSRVP